MQIVSVNEILQTISSLPAEDQYFIADVLNKRIIDLRRTEIALRGEEAQRNYESGNFMSGTVADLMRAADED